MTPQLSVVVPSVNGWDDLERALSALEVERAQVALEVLVPERCGDAVRAQVSARFPWAQLLPVGPEQTIPEMRALAFDAATAPSVAVIEDHVLVPAGWAAQVLEARKHAQVVGGAVRNAATETTVDWAAFLAEYSHLLPPLAGGARRWITGNNTVYDRALLVAHRAATHAGRWEHHLHEELLKSGVELTCRPEIVVDHKKHYRAGEYLAQRYFYARGFAADRLAARGPLARALYGAAAFALPPLLFGRTVGRALGKEVDRAMLAKSLPLIGLFVCASGVGEVVGSWFGAGDSMRKVC